jgi:hypothetical protein
MRRYQSSCAWLVAAMVFLFGTDALVAGEPDKPVELPAILTSLESRGVTILDDESAKTIRGQGSEYRYVLVRILGVNTFDFAPGLEFTGNLFAWRYGAFGGAFWTNGGRTDIVVSPADLMDEHFMSHDQGSLTDQGLVIALGSLPNTANNIWGQIYIPGEINPASNLPVGQNVWVSAASLFAGKFYLGWKPMPFTEYARRQAFTAMRLLALVP